MGRGGGLVFTGMPRRREVLGTGIIRWEKVINPDGSVTWQEAQPTTASVTSSKKEEKGTKAEKQKLERPSWIETKKEATTTNTKRPAKEVEDLAAPKEPTVEEARPRRAFSFHQTEEKKAERKEKTTHVEEIRFSAPIRKDDEKKGGVVAGLATKFGSTKKAEDMPIPKKDMPLQVEIQPTSASTSTHHTFLHLPTEEKLNTPPPLLSPPTTEEKKINPIADDYFSHSHWSIRDDSKQESDAELAQRLANTEKIFRQQEQKIQAALDRIRDLERQLASGFTATATGGEQQDDDDDEEVQTETGTKTWDNESIAAGGRESGPHFRQLHGNSSKGPLPCFSGDEPHFHYRVLTVNSHKPQVINNNMNVRELRHHEGSSSGTFNDNSDSDSDDNRTPSPIAVTFNIPAPPKPAATSLNPPPSKRQQQLPTTKTANFLDPITKSPQSFVLQSLKHEPTTPSSVKTTTTATRGPKKHKPLPLLPTDARAIPVRPSPSLRSPLSPLSPLSPSSSTPLVSTSPTFPPTPTSPSPTTTPTKPSFCIPHSPHPYPPNSANRPPSRPTYHRSVSNFKNKVKLRPLTPIPEEPCPLKRRPRVRMRRSMSRSMSLSMAGDCDAPSDSGNGNGRPGTGSGSGRTQCAGGEEELGGSSSSRGWRLLDRVRTN